MALKIAVNTALKTFLQLDHIWQYHFELQPTHLKVYGECIWLLKFITSWHIVLSNVKSLVNGYFDRKIAQYYKTQTISSISKPINLFDITFNSAIIPPVYFNFIVKSGSYL